LNLKQLKGISSLIYKNFSGWRTDRKIIVIESDDWGSIRMPSRAVYEKCLQAGYRVDKNAYERFDSLASEDDLMHLFDLLSSFRDIKGRHPVITANVLVANPDFDKIRESDYREYYYELVTKTFKKYTKHQKSFEIWLEGLNEGVFFPQSHGREHLNVSRFMNALQIGDADVHFGFRERMPGNIGRGETSGGNKYVEALHYSDEKDKTKKLEIILEGLNLFEKLFGYKSESFIPPNYRWSPDFDNIVAEAGVRYYQGNYKMLEPIEDGRVKINSYYLGQLNRFDQSYLVRNAMFEPSLFRNNVNDPVTKCLRDIQIAFAMRKPAIICSHRLNYIGYIDQGNRDRNLVLLNNLLKNILKKWPDVEFMNSVELGKLINT